MALRHRIYEIRAEHPNRPFRALWKWATRPDKWKSRIVRFQALQGWANDRAKYHKRRNHPKRAQRWFRRAEAYRKKWRSIKRKHASAGGNVVIQAGSPHWGGSDDILENEVEPVARSWGFPVTSAKRYDTLGNPSSDHYVGNTTASARDFGAGTNYPFRDACMRALGVNGPISDYGSYYITRAGRRFRVQPIAQNHGTGPHCHIGIRLA
jgi:hypothetical protein